MRSLIAFLAIALVAADASAAAPCASCGCQSRQRFTPLKNLAENVRAHRAAVRQSAPVAPATAVPMVMPGPSRAYVLPAGGSSCPGGVCPAPTAPRRRLLLFP